MTPLRVIPHLLTSSPTLGEEELKVFDFPSPSVGEAVLHEESGFRLVEGLRDEVDMFNYCLN